MARNVQAHLEAEADKKGLEGEQRKAYIGGAWARIKSHEGGRSREWWRDDREYAALSALVGPVEEIKTVKGKRDKVYFRQGDEWYELPQAEYFRLSHEGRELLREQEREGREEKRRGRSAEREKEYQQKQLMAMERAEHSEVVDILRKAGGIKPSKSRMSGHERDASEYRMLPSTVRNTRGHLTMDEAATEINQHMPWLHIETPDDLVQYFERRGTKRRQDQARKYSERAAKVAGKEAERRERAIARTEGKSYTIGGITVKADHNRMTPEEREAHWRAMDETAVHFNNHPKESSQGKRREQTLARRRDIMAEIFALEDKAHEADRKKELYYGTYRSTLLRNQARELEHKLYKLDKDFHQGEYMRERMRRLSAS